MQTSFINNYDIKNFELMNMNRIDTVYDGQRVKFYAVELKITTKDKIKFIDIMKNGIATYFINLFTLWVNEKNSLPKQKGRMNTINTNSKIAWIKRNDTQQQIGTSYGVGMIRDNKSYIRMLNDNMTFDDKDKELFINFYFHQLLIELEISERKYFKETDSRMIKLRQLTEYINKYGQLNNNIKVNDILWNGDENIEENDIDYLIEKYKEIEKVFTKVSNEVLAKYPQWIYEEEEE